MGTARPHRRPWHLATAVVAAAGLFATVSACTTPDPERSPVDLARNAERRDLISHVKREDMAVFAPAQTKAFQRGSL